jgi:hypothetical protein
MLLGNYYCYNNSMPKLIYALTVNGPSSMLSIPSRALGPGYIKPIPLAETVVSLT